MRPARAVLGALLVALLIPATAAAHPERLTAFTWPVKGKVPTYRTSGPSNVVCKASSGKLLRKTFKGAALKKRLKMLNRCAFHDIQAAIDKAKSGYRILILPGVYKEQSSRRVPFGAPGQPPCKDDYVTVEEGYGDAPPPAGPASNDKPERPNRNYAIKCPNSKNLIAVIGDTREEKTPSNPTVPICVQLCNLQIEGMGRLPKDVRIVGDRIKTDVVR